jgi:hypothetical protein
MRHCKRWLAVLGLLVAVLQLSACTQTAAEAEATGGEEPAKVEHLEGSDDLSRLTLDAKAVERLGIKTAALREETVAGKSRKVVPYGAVLYDPDGKTWVYVSSAPNVYVREPITVDFIEGDRAVLEAGPAAGTTVVTVGVAELYGTETGVGH